MTAGIRRVVTGLDAQGRSAVLFDDHLPGEGTQVIWQTSTIPVDNSGTEDAAVSGYSFDLLRSPGSTFLIAQMQPGDTAAGPFMHATDTTDYLIILKGRVRLQLETCSVDLEAGDCIVDRGVSHGWQVLGDEPLVMATILVPAKPVGAGATI